MPGQADHFPRKVQDLHRLSHIEYEDLAALCVGAALENQVHCLRYGHEITDDIRVRHSHRTAVLDLLAEDRDDAAVAAQHVAEADGSILGL